MIKATSSDLQGSSHSNDPQSDPFTEDQLMNPSLRSGCRVQVQPVLSEPCYEENRLNRLKSHAQSVPVIADGQAKLYPSRTVRLFPTQAKSEDGASQRGPPVTPQAWSGLAGFRVMGSFKKLRTSVLQGIQNRSNAMGASQERNLSSVIEDSSSFLVTKREISISQTHETEKVLNGTSRTRKTSSVSDEDDCEEVCGFQRNSHFSQSIRKAYGAGRISMLDMVNKQSLSTAEPDPVNTVESTEPCNNQDTQGNVKVLKRLSKSADNLHVFKTHFRRKVATAEPQNPECSSTVMLQRTSSSSSVDLQEHVLGSHQSPMRTRGHLQKLVGSLTDLTVKRKNIASPSPRVPVSPLSQLHDDYSRRTPCVPTSGRQRRPSPVPTKTQQDSTCQTIPILHPAPSCPAVFISDLDDSLEPPSKTTALISDYVQMAVSSSELHIGDSACPPEKYCEPMECHQNGLNDHYSQIPQQCSSPCLKPTVNGNDVNLQCLWTEERETDDLEASSDNRITRAFLKSDEASTPAASPITNSCCSESPLGTPTTPNSPAFVSASPTSVVPRKRAGRSKPRPVSDYGQLASSKFCILEEDRELENMDYTSQKDYISNGSYIESSRPENGHVCTQKESRKRRPISVIGGVDLYSSQPAEQKDDTESLPSPVCRPPVPSHRVPPYRAVSARLRPCVFSQSTPIGLDRMGRRKGRRVLSDGSSDPMLEDSVSEEDGSFEELTEGTPYLQPEVDLFTLNQHIESGRAVYAEALWDHVTMEEQELAFKAGEVIRVLDVQEQDWWWGMVGDREAWFPSSFVRVRVNQEDSSSESVESTPDTEEPIPSDSHKQNPEHRKQMRANVVKEIMDTERVYIKHLKDICEGYIRQCRKHPGMFTDTQLKTIFSNIEDIYRFQRKFLKDLERKYNPENPHLSEIGSCFLQQEEGFSIYSEYCNTHPVACAELQRLMKQSRYKHFFEACRLLQQMIDISIAGFLLTPVQKICKYPLQLGELLKYTPKEHSDFAGVCAAHKAMKNVASLINERKRRLESIDTIAHWQVAILHWAGEDVLARSSELIHSGELTRIVRPGKTQQRSYFLFDHQLVFCKKDVLRRDLLHYRGRMDTDLLEPSDLPDGRHTELGLLKNAFLLRHAENLNVLCVLCCKKSQDKQRWLQAFARERKRVQEDQEMGMEITEAQRKQAVHNARKSKHGKMKNMNYSGHPAPPHHQPLHPLHQRHVTVPTSVPQQQVFTLAEPKKKPSHLLYSLARSALFRK
ncbi:spermatogenesis-associated protein 13 isoform X1 [Danio rerio]|uniref:Spermatogenesis-associated 13 n=3 Tax=Danio rerio TaxID=7955 RepID=A0A8M2B9P0_DANRE|nr:spermatogenesis-associated protein 13 isoform X1 [Danio rerio]XP_021329453.1 spermatogenesis-associated protein 13 isoform X1 [Danio rerio]|eukprot:XP_005162798.1 spermatogenesis-associated protein 13 isoform X1 [Danio rerio]